MRAHAGCEHAIPLPERLLPERHARQRPVHVLVPAPHVVDEEIEPAVLVADATEERLDVGVNGVVAAHGDAAPAKLGDLTRRSIDRPGKLVGRRAAVDASSRDVDRGAGDTQFTGDAATGAAAGAGDERNERT